MNEMANDIGAQQLLVCLGCPRITGDSSGASSFLSGDQLFGRLMFLPLKISGKDSVVDPDPEPYVFGPSGSVIIL